MQLKYRTSRTLSALAIAATLSTAAAMPPEVPPSDRQSYRNPSETIDQRIADLLSRMMLREKAAQMAIGERATVTDEDVSTLGIGGILDDAGSTPQPNTPDAWASMVTRYQNDAAHTRLGIPVLYGFDAGRGVGSVVPGATMFPHPIGLAATGDEHLMRQVGEIASREMAALGVYWNVAPMASAISAARTGRQYDSMGANTATSGRLMRAYVDGYQHGLAGLEGGAPTPLPGFDGLAVSDRDAILQLPGSFHEQVVASLNAGMDMAILPKDWRAFIDEVIKAVHGGEITERRIDDAVRHILRVKLRMGLFERNLPLASARPLFGSAQHRAVARDAVRKSLVLLKNRHALPLPRTGRILVAGSAADDLVRQASAWAVSGNEAFPGTSLLAGLKEAAGTDGQVDYDAAAEFADVAPGHLADAGVVFAGATPDAEGKSGRGIDEPALSKEDVAAIVRMRAKAKKLIVVMVANRPVTITEIAARVDSLVMAWLPGSEGAGVADMLFGHAAFTGRLPVAWPRDGGTLFPLGFGLKR